MPCPYRSIRRPARVAASASRTGRGSAIPPAVHDAGTSTFAPSGFRSPDPAPHQSKRTKASFIVIRVGTRHAVSLGRDVISPRKTRHAVSSSGAQQAAPLRLGKNLLPLQHNDLYFVRRCVVTCPPAGRSTISVGKGVALPNVGAASGAPTLADRWRVPF